MSKAKTAEEVRTELLETMRALAKYWATVGDMSPEERCDGVVFSILNIFDGTSASLPAFDIHVAPHEDDKQYHIEQGEDYYEPNMLINNCMLHEIYCNNTREED